MARKKPKNPKLRALREHGSLNPHPEKVRDPRFTSDDFFDVHDLVQVKYEMIRRVRVDGESISESAKTFGFSRPTFYQARAAFEEGGLGALLPRKRGPRRAHKLGKEVVDFVRQAKSEDASLREKDLVRLVKERFDLSVHPRSIARALVREKKTR